MADYAEVEDARDLPGLRLVLTAGVPGPWGEAAKGLFHVEKIRYVRVRQNEGLPNEALLEWTGHDNAPIAVYEHEKPRSVWTEIIWLAERLAPEPALAEAAPERAAAILRLLAATLASQRERGSDTFLGDRLTALDVYWAAFAARVAPLPEELCPMPPMIRKQYPASDPVLAAALDSPLLEHRDRTYQNHLELPVDV
jgi:hypothetical protein